jgi:hypothetical protein
MTTLEEIQTSRRANRHFWNGQVSNAIRWHRKPGSAWLAPVREYLQARRTFKYYEGGQPQQLTFDFGGAK